MKRKSSRSTPRKSASARRPAGTKSGRVARKPRPKSKVKAGASRRAKPARSPRRAAPSRKVRAKGARSRPARKPARKAASTRNAAAARDSFPPTPSQAPGGPAGRMIVHGDEVGSPGIADADRRAREIALIGDHPVGPDDLADAERELSGEPVPPEAANGGESEGSLSRDPSDPAADRGHQAPTFEGDDEEQVAERLVTEGVDEAEHDQMVAARRRRQPD